MIAVAAPGISLIYPQMSQMFTDEEEQRWHLSIGFPSQRLAPYPWFSDKVAPATTMLPHGAVFVYPLGNRPDDEIVVAYLGLT
jgi:hypothetical protein